MLEQFKSLGSLDELLAKVAEALGVGVEMLQENGLEYIMMYGKYEAFTKAINEFMFWIIILSVLWIFAMVGFAAVIADGYNDEDDWKVYKKWIVEMPPIPIVSIAIVAAMSKILPYLVSPEVYSIKKVLELLN